MQSVLAKGTEKVNGLKMLSVNVRSVTATEVSLG